MARPALCLAIAALLTLTAPASATTSVYSGSMSGGAESPANASPGTGTAKITIDFAQSTMHVEASFSSLTGTTTASHIHCCVAPPGTVGVATTVPTFTGFPLGVTNGTYDHVFDLTLATSYNSAFITANGGTVASAFNALVAGLNAGHAYFNIHSTVFPGGEIRTFLIVAPNLQTTGSRKAHAGAGTFDLPLAPGP